MLGPLLPIACGQLHQPFELLQRQLTALPIAPATAALNLHLPLPSGQAREEAPKALVGPGVAREHRPVAPQCLEA